jgi:hypothetical protein
VRRASARDPEMSPSPRKTTDLALKLDTVQYPYRGARG